MNAGGSNTITSYLSFNDSCLNKLNVSSHITFNCSKPFNLALTKISSHAFLDISHASTCLAPYLQACKAKPPTLEKQSNTTLSLAYNLKISLFNF